MANPIISLIEQEIETLLAGLSVATGFRLNWSPVNFDDRAIENHTLYNCFSTVNFISEENHDDVNVTHGNAYSNKALYIITCRVPLTTESTKPSYAQRKELYKAQEDVKKVFGLYPQLNSVYATNVQYNSSQISDDTLLKGDRFTPTMLEIYIEVWYFQSRINPAVIVP